VNAVHQRDFTDLCLSTVGIIFLGAPFQGSDVAIFGEWLARLLCLDATLLRALRKGSQELYVLSSDFYNSYADRDLVCFYEKKDTSFIRALNAQVYHYPSLPLLLSINVTLNPL